MEKHTSIHITNDVLAKLKKAIASLTSKVKLYICVPSVIDNLPESRQELILIIRGLLLILHNDIFNNSKHITKKLIRKYSTTAQLLFIKLTSKCDVKVAINGTQVNGHIEGINPSKYIAIVTENNDKIIASFDELVVDSDVNGNNSVKNIISGGTIKDSVNELLSEMTGDVSSDMSGSYKSYDFIESHRAHSSPASENNYFSELTSIEEGLCE